MGYLYIYIDIYIYIYMGYLYIYIYIYIYICIYGVFITKMLIERRDQFYITGLYVFCVFNCEEKLSNRTAM